MTLCCQTPICDRCVARNPRLKEYSPCLRCGDVRTADGLGRIERGRAETSRRRREEEEGRFVLEDSDEEDHVDERRHDRPPSYRSGSGSFKSGHSPSRTGTNGDTRLEARSSGAEAPHIPSQEAAEERELVEVKHPVARNDTVLSIARRYGADVSEPLRSDHAGCLAYLVLATRSALSEYSSTNSSIKQPTDSSDSKSDRHFAAVHEEGIPTRRARL